MKAESMILPKIRQVSQSVELSAPQRQEMVDEPIRRNHCAEIRDCLGHMTVIGGATGASLTLCAPLLYFTSKLCQPRTINGSQIPSAILLSLAAPIAILPAMAGAGLLGNIGLFASPYVAAYGEPSCIRSASETIQNDVYQAFR
jgi:hypothetical protein